MHLIGSTEAKESTQRTVGDSLRLQMTVPKWAREAMKVDGGEKIWARAESNGTEIEYVADLHGNGRTFVLPIDQRRELSLNVGNSVQFWVSKYDQEEESVDTIDESQQENESDSEKESFIAIRDRADLTYHIRDGDTTVCGIELDGHSTKDVSNPGDALDPCPKCNIQNPEDLSNEQIVSYLAEEADFEPNESNPSYFTKTHLVALMDLVISLKEQ